MAQDSNTSEFSAKFSTLNVNAMEFVPSFQYSQSLATNTMDNTSSNNTTSSLTTSSSIIPPPVENIEETLVENKINNGR